MFATRVSQKAFWEIRWWFALTQCHLPPTWGTKQTHLGPVPNPMVGGGINPPFQLSPCAKKNQPDMEADLMMSMTCDRNGINVCRLECWSIKCLALLAAVWRPQRRPKKSVHFLRLWSIFRSFPFFQKPVNHFLFLENQSITTSPRGRKSNCMASHFCSMPPEILQLEGQSNHHSDLLPPKAGFCLRVRSTLGFSWCAFLIEAWIFLFFL